MSKDQSFTSILYQRVQNGSVVIKERPFKGIGSRDFGVLFLIYLDRYEVPNRAGSGLFFILKRSSYSNFKKVGIVSI
jgi:hypothetical protein